MGPDDFLPDDHDEYESQPNNGILWDQDLNAWDQQANRPPFRGKGCVLLSHDELVRLVNLGTDVRIPLRLAAWDHKRTISNTRCITIQTIPLVSDVHRARLSKADTLRVRIVKIMATKRPPAPKEATDRPGFWERYWTVRALQVAGLKNYGDTSVAIRAELLRMEEDELVDQTSFDGGKSIVVRPTVLLKGETV